MSSVDQKSFDLEKGVGKVSLNVITMYANKNVHGIQLDKKAIFSWLLPSSSFKGLKCTAINYLLSFRFLI